MTETESLKEQIAKANKVLAESRENLDKNPDDYSAKLLVVSLENHIADLYKQLEAEEAPGKSS